MAFAALNNVEDIDIGKFLKIYSANGVYNNLSEASEVWKMFLKKKESDPEGREYRYLLRKEYGAAAAQMLGVSPVGDYPAAQRSGIEEAVAVYKDYGLTVNVPRTLLDKRGSELAQYADPLIEELEAKGIVMARLLSGRLLGDGSGAIGSVTGAGSISAGRATFTLSTADSLADRSHVGWFEEGDFLKIHNTDGTATVPTVGAGTHANYKVVDLDEENDTVTLASVDASGTELTITATNVIATDLIYRIGITPNDLTAISTNDYNTLSEAWPGLPSLIADDGRKVHGITHESAFKGTQRDVSGALIDSQDFQNLLSTIKRRVGRNRYKYDYALMFDTVYDSLIDGNETDRRFQTTDDTQRGVKKIGYQHGKDFVEFMPDEFVPKNRIYVLPSDKDVCIFRGKDFKMVEPNPGQKFHLRPSTSGAGYSRENVAFMEGSGVPIIKHPAACGIIRNFTV